MWTVWASAISKRQKRSAYAANRDSSGRIRRPGSDPLGYRAGQGSVDLRKWVRDHDSELRSGGTRRRMQRAVGAVGLAGAVSVRDEARHHGCYVAGGL